MPIEKSATDVRRSTTSRTIGNLVLCQGFAFRPINVDGFSHHVLPDSEAITIVNFKGYTQSVPDPEKRLFDFLVRTLSPAPVDEDV